MSRVIKFRAWTGGVMTYFVFPDDYTGYGSAVWMEWTGLKDKHGVEIYEWDVVKIWGDSDGAGSNEYEEDDVVEFRDGQWWWGKHGNSQPLYELDTDCSVVIGNIYENPSLLDV